MYPLSPEVRRAPGCEERRRSLQNARPAGTGEGLRLAKERLDQKNVYYLNPGFDSK